MLDVLLIVVGVVIGFAGARRLRRPDRAAAASSVARQVGATVGRRRTLTPPELQRACFSEMVRHVQVTRGGQTRAPSRYVIDMHPDDLAVVDETRRWFHDGLVDALGQAAAENGWVLDAKPSIEFRADPSRHLGVPNALAVAPDQPDSVPAPPPPAARTGTRSLVVTRSDTSEAYPLGAAPVTIGRSRDRTITLEDNRVSRSHARIEAISGGWAVVDEGSANGTTVGGEELVPHRPRPLRAGDVIAVGSVDLFVAPGPTGAGPGTRALGDRERTRISSRVLPPPGRADR